jgi:threonine/homoserine/homoserine lactone efflux protein
VTDPHRDPPRAVLPRLATQRSLASYARPVHETTMSDPVLFSMAVLALLATPGPTNALLATAGAMRGFRRASPLLAVEGVAYLTAISAIHLALRPALEAHPALRDGLKITVAAYLLWTAWRLWSASGTGRSGTGASITASQVFVTTLLNPKALIFATVILPFGQAGSAVYLAGFNLLAAGVGAVWIALGAVLGAAPTAAPKGQLVARISAVALSGFALALVTGPLLR